MSVRVFFPFPPLNTYLINTMNDAREQMNLKYHLFEVQTEIVERLALETGAGVFRLVAEHKVRVCVLT